MAKTKELRKPKKFVAGISCAALAVLTLIPATAVSAKAAKLQEDWIRAEETSIEVEPPVYFDLSMVECGYDDGSVVETNGSQEIEIYSSTDDLSKTIEANTRHIYQYRSMSDGRFCIYINKV